MDFSSPCHLSCDLMNCWLIVILQEIIQKGVDRYVLIIMQFWTLINDENIV